MNEEEILMFTWMTLPESYNMEGDKIVVCAGKGTNVFDEPSGNFRDTNFPFYCEEWEGDFVLSAKINPVFNSLYDLGCLMVWQDEDKWIKFAYENSDAGFPSIVSVVTNEYSDDCN